MGHNWHIVVSEVFGHAQPDQLNWALKMGYLIAIFILDELSIIINLVLNWM